MRNALLTAIASAFLVLSSQPQAVADSFLHYAWACPDEKSYRESRRAFVNLDQDAFEATDCVSIRPGTKYRLLRCDPDVPTEDLEKFDYEIERSEEVTLDRCEVSVTNDKGVSKLYFIYYTKLLLLKP